MKCEYCYRDLLPKEDVVQFDEISCSTVLNIVKLASQRLQAPISITFTGGEPLLRLNDLVLILKNLKSLNSLISSISIITNGTLLSKTNICLLLDAYPSLYLDVSIDGPEEIHNLQRQYKGNVNYYSKIISGINCAKELGLKISLSSVITKLHLDYTASKYYTFMQSFGLPWYAGKISADSELTQYNISDSEFTDFAIEMINEWANDTCEKPVAWIDGILEIILSRKNNITSPKCADASMVFAGNSGYAWPCSRMVPLKKYVLGKLEDGLDKLFNSPLRKSISNLFYRENTCAHESLIRNGFFSALPECASERERLFEYLMPYVYGTHIS